MSGPSADEVQALEDAGFSPTGNRGQWRRGNQLVHIFHPGQASGSAETGYMPLDEVLAMLDLVEELAREHQPPSK